MSCVDNVCPGCQSVIKYDSRRGHQKYCSAACSHAAQSKRWQSDTPTDLLIKAGKTCREISEELGIPQANIRSRARTRGLVIKLSPVLHTDRRPVSKTRGVAKSRVRIPGEPDPRKVARALHKAGKSALVISGLTGLSRAVLSPLLGEPMPPVESEAHKPRERAMWENAITPALWGTDTVFDGPIKPRAYRVLHDADLTSDGHAMGSEWLTTHDLGEALNNCHGKNSVVVDDHGLVLAKGVKHFYRKDKYQ